MGNAMNTVWGTTKSTKSTIDSAIRVHLLASRVDAALANEFSAEEVTGSFAAQGVQILECVEKTFDVHDAAADDWSDLNA